MTSRHLDVGLQPHELARLVASLDRSEESRSAFCKILAIHGELMHEFGDLLGSLPDEAAIVESSGRTPSL